MLFQGHLVVERQSSPKLYPSSPTLMLSSMWAVGKGEMRWQKFKIYDFILLGVGLIVRMRK